MKVVLVLIGLFIGAVVGAILGVCAGLAWTTIFHTTSFEGYSGMLVFFTFMPIGLVIGAIAGAVGFGVMASRTPPAPS